MADRRARNTTATHTAITHICQNEKYVKINAQNIKQIYRYHLSCIIDLKYLYQQSKFILP